MTVDSLESRIEDFEKQLEQILYPSAERIC